MGLVGVVILIRSAQYVQYHKYYLISCLLVCLDLLSSLPPGIGRLSTGRHTLCLASAQKGGRTTVDTEDTIVLTRP